MGSSSEGLGLRTEGGTMRTEEIRVRLAKCLARGDRTGGECFSRELVGRLAGRSVVGSDRYMGGREMLRKGA